MEIGLIDIFITLLTAGVFSLIGFVWRFSHKVTRIEQNQGDIKRRVDNMESDHDKVMDRMYSMAKSKGK